MALSSDTIVWAPPADPSIALLFSAIRADDAQQLERALSEGASVDSTVNVEATEGLSAGIVTALMFAVKLGCTCIAKLLLERGADVHARRPHNGATALYVAAYYGNVEMITALAGAGGDVDTASNNGFAAVHAATSMGHAEVVRLLAELGARVEAPVNSGTATPVYLAALNGHVKVVRVLAELGASVKTQGKDGSTPLFAAAQEGHVGVVRVLAELGACVRKAANDGFTPVHVAAQMGHAEVIRLLASLKADIAARWVPEPNKLGWSPFALSADGAHFEATKALLLLGAPFTIKDLKQDSRAEGDTRQLRADLQAWAADALVQHRIFTNTFLFGCSAHGDIALTILEGEEELRAQVAEFVGIVVGKELRRTRAMGPAIAAIDWAPHDDPWPVESESEDEDEEEE